MIDALLSLVPGGGLTAAGGALVALLLAAWRIFAAGKAVERGKTAQRDLKAANDQLEMHREAGAVEREARNLSDEEARRKAAKWSRPR